MMGHNALIRLFGFVLFAMVAGGCGKSTSPPPQMPPPEVGVVIAHATAVPLVQELVGRLSAVRSADVRARVAGVLQKRVYTEGSDVKQGQVMFKIDPAPLQATLNAQLANLAAARATYTNNHIAAERARSVGTKGFISKADVDTANAAERTAAATVKQAQANVESAKINLGYADVTAPIAGRAGQQQVTEGALVGQGDATLLTTIDQIDSLYINFSQAVGTLDAERQGAANGHVQLFDQDKAKVELLLPDGSTYAHAGSLDFSATRVDPTTGAVTLRGVVPNPDHALLPGMYVTVRLTRGELTHAWLVSQLAVQRDSQGAFVFVVGPDDKVVQKWIKADSLRGENWIVMDGLADGDQIVVSGVQKVKPGESAKPTPWKGGAQDAAGNSGAPGAATTPAPPKVK